MTIEEFYNSLKRLLDRRVVIFKDENNCVYNGLMRDTEIDNELFKYKIKNITTGNTGCIVVNI